ncbi:16196_t:CDS:10 [Funneliformis geosporum]|uniref:16196_t:CDS:1 n=1 Tax=Funneliformis geosporum TaxID=1117311 RepID=A0A9W4SVF1_9GLOM|nr:16196_t:CDS:10 [Funneliformis geosporum]
MPVRENPLSSLSLFVPQIFQDVQKTVTNHRKNAAALRKFQLQCSTFNQVTRSSSISSRGSSGSDILGEVEFNKEFARNLNKILPLKKGQATAERVVTFIATFIKYCHDKENGNESKNDDDSHSSVYDSDTLSSFTEFLLRHLLKGTEAKDRNVRLRVCKLIALIMNSIGTVDDDLYEYLKDELSKRLFDKEASVRVNAVVAFSKLLGDNEIGKDVTEKLLGLMQNDPSAEVRRAVLLNIEFSEKTIPYIFNRARDIDASIRCNVYTRSKEEIGDFRVLSIEVRENLLKHGLTDRDPQVKKACSNMLANGWIKHANDNFLELLERIDVVGSKIAPDVLLALFKSRPDIVQTLNFDGSFWENLTIESVFLARVFCEFNKEDENRLDDILPEVSKFALYVQNFINLMNQASDDEQVNYEFIVGQLLLISKFLNYGDEVGRRQMFTLLREILMLDHIPEGHIESVVEIMKKISIDERDFTRYMIDILSDIRETIEDCNDPLRLRFQAEDELVANMSNLSISMSSMRKSLASETRSERRMSIDSNSTINDEEYELEALITNLKCLHIVRCILEKNEVGLRDNPSMYGLLNDFITPNIKRHEPLLREISVQCLGLCCLLDPQLMNENLSLFMYCVRHGNPELQVKALMVIFDILLVYGYSSIVDKTKHANPQVQAIAVEGIAKLMLSKMICEKDVLKELIMLYFDVGTTNNFRLRQCLSYFLPVYCHSSVENQRLMQQICVSSLTDLIEERRQHKDKELIPPMQIAQQLIDWTDPFKVVKSEQNEEVIDYGAHADIAIDIIKELFSETNREVRKLYSQILNKLNIDESTSIIRFKKLTLLVGNLKKKKPLVDAVGRNAFNKFENSLLQHYDEAPDPLDDNELEQLKDIIDFIRNIQEASPDRVSSRSLRSR